MRPDQDIERTMERHADTVWRVCLLYFACEADCQDAFQETFLRYALADTTTFADDEHRKAWLIRVARTRCLDMLKAAHRTRTASGDEALGAAESQQAVEQRAAQPAAPPDEQPGSFTSEVVDALQALDDPPRTPLYLALCEEYTAPEIAQLLDAPVNTVYSWIARGKKHLREVLS